MDTEQWIIFVGLLGIFIIYGLLKAYIGKKKGIK